MSIVNAINNRAAKIASALRISGKILETEMHRLVAIDTGELDRSVTTGAVEKTPTGQAIEVGSINNHYARFVETSSKTKNYHRNGEVVYTGKGQKWATRSLENKKQEILSEISKSFR